MRTPRATTSLTAPTGGRVGAWPPSITPPRPNTDPNTNTTSITIADVDNSKTYIVGVRARNNHGDSGWRNSPAAGPYTPPPDAPTGLTATPGDGTVTLTWDDPSDSSLTSYEYNMRWTGIGWQPWTAIADSGAATTSHTVEGLTNGTKYRFHVRAVNASGAGTAAPNAPPWYITATPQAPPPPATPKPNVVVITADDLGYNDVSFNGATDITTPNIDKLAQTGVTFTRGYVSAPLCTPSRVGLLTGRYPLRSGVQVNWVHLPQDPEDPLYGLAPTEKTVATYLQEAGYRTGMVGKWQIGSADGLRPLDRGFDYFYGMLGGGHIYYDYGVDSTSNNSYYYPLSEDVPHHWLLGGNYQQLVNFTEVKPYLTDALTDKAVDFITAAASTTDPWFLQLSYNAPHNPLEAPADLVSKYEASGHGHDRARYLAMIDNLDQNVGRILGAVTAAGERKNTLVFFLSDNGGPMTWADNGALRGGKAGYHEGGIRVPFVASWPGRWPAGANYDKPVINLDIAATAMAMAGVTPDAELPLDGVNLDGYVRAAETGGPHEALFWHWWNPGNQGNDSGYAVVSGELKLVKEEADGGVELFDLSSDPGEATDLFDETSTTPSQARTDAERLRALWNSWNDENQVSLYWGLDEYRALQPWTRAAKTREIQCANGKRQPLQIGTDFLPAEASSGGSAVPATGQGTGGTPALSVTEFGGATWIYAVPAGHTFSNAEIRWLQRGSEDLGDWSGYSSQVFNSECVYSWQIPSLSANAAYKAKLLVATLDSGGQTHYLESNTVVFPPSMPPTLVVADSGAVSWSYTLPAGYTFNYVELRWRETDTEDLNDWTTYSNQVFYSENATSSQIPDLTDGAAYKAKLFVGASDGNANHYLKSDTVVFAASN